MPNLINVIRSARLASSSKSNKTTKSQTDEERKAEVARLLNLTVGESKAETETDSEIEGDMEWGTILVFSCIKDCCKAKASAANGKWVDVQAAWKDEYVVVQWDA
jgi:pre-rRNA-processing protein TSR4